MKIRVKESVESDDREFRSPLARKYIKTAIKRLAGRIFKMSGFQILTLFLYVPGLVWLSVGFIENLLVPGPRFPLIALPVALLTWTILYLLFAGLAYAVGNLIPRREIS